MSTDYELIGIKYSMESVKGSFSWTNLWLFILVINTLTLTMHLSNINKSIKALAPNQTIQNPSTEKVPASPVKVTSTENPNTEIDKSAFAKRSTE